MLRTFSALVLAAMVTISAPPSHARPAGGDASPPAARAVVELSVRTASGSSQTTTLVLALSDDHGSSTAELSSAASSLKLEVQRSGSGRPGSVPTLEVKLWRSEGGRHSAGIDVKARVALGHKLVLGTLPTADGGELKVSVTLE